jgi:hypothetical protein
MKTVPNALGTVVNFSRFRKHENGTQRPRNHYKMSPGAQNMATGLNALATAQNESGISKHEN